MTACGNQYKKITCNEGGPFFTLTAHTLMRIDRAVILVDHIQAPEDVVVCFEVFKNGQTGGESVIRRGANGPVPNVALQSGETLSLKAIAREHDGALCEYPVYLHDVAITWTSA